MAMPRGLARCGATLGLFLFCLFSHPRVVQQTTPWRSAVKELRWLWALLRMAIADIGRDRSIFL